MTAASRVALDDPRLLDAWERANAHVRPWRELELLAAATGEPLARLAGLPIGERDRRLLDVREDTFGRLLDCETTCPACGDRLELTLDVEHVRGLARAGVPGPAGVPATVRAGGWQVTFRLPDSADVAAARGPEADRDASGAAGLFERCVVAATHDGASTPASAVPEEIRDLVADRMVELDPGADVRLELACPSCGHRWFEGLDPAGFVLMEVDAYAQRLLGDVDTLARAYGWRESDVLALGPFRRRRYIELVAR